MFTAEDFQIAEMVLDIIVRNAHDRVFFIVTFPDERPQLVLTRLVNQDDQKVWTLIPGGIWQRQLIGPEVINHFKNKK